MKRCRRLVCCWLILLLASPIVLAKEPPDTPTPGKLPPLKERWNNGWRNVGDDARYLVTFPSRPTKKGVGTTIGILAAVGLVMVYDQKIRDEVQGQRNATTDQWESYLEPMGRLVIQMGVFGLVYAGGRAAGDEEATEAARALIEAVSMTEVATYAGKVAFGRTDPSDLLNAGQFLEGGKRFPSGHASRAFAVATVLSERYGPKVAWFAYPLAALVALARLENDEHWASDVVAGAALGWGISKSIVRLRAQRRGGRLPRSGSSTEVDVSPIFAPERRAVGVHFQVRF